MEKLTNIIEAVIFASGDAITIKELAKKLEVSKKEVNESISTLLEKYSGDSGIHLLVFNDKVQFATNPIYHDPVGSILTAVKEKEFTKTILECAAVIAYQQPITRAELELIRGVNSDYAIHTLLEINMIKAVGKKDVIGHPTMFGTTDNFLKRFKLKSLDELPDYEELMAQIAELNEGILDDEENAFLFRKVSSENFDEQVEMPEFFDDGDEEVFKIG